MQLSLAISGAGGFLGASAVTHFSRHPNVREVRALLGPHHPGIPGQKTFFSGDLRDPKLVREWLGDANAVLHFAHRGYPADGNADTLAENTEATRVLLSVMRERGIRRLIYPSTGGALYRVGNHTPFTEESPVEFRSAYAVAKLAVEGLLAVESGIDSTILRVSNPYGTGQFGRTRQGLIGILFRKALTKQPIQIWGSPATVKDFVYISDVLAALDASLFRVAALKGVFNVGSGVGTTLEEAIAAVAETTGLELRCEPQPAKAWDASWTVLDTTKFQQATGWRPAVSFSDGVRRMWTEIEALHSGLSAA